MLSAVFDHPLIPCVLPHSGQDHSLLPLSW